MKDSVSLKLLFLGLAIAICTSFALAQNQQKKNSWKSITPLISTLQDVESLLGPPTTIDRTSRYYDTPAGERVTVWYSGKPDNSSCRWNVPDDTVINVIVSPRKRLLLSETGFDLRQFKKQRPADDSGWNYINETKGIFIDTYDEPNLNDGYIRFIELTPTQKDTKRCIPTSTETRSERDRKLRIKQSSFVPPVAQIIPELYDLYLNQESPAAKKERLDAYAKELAEKPFYGGVIVSYGRLGKSDCEAVTNLKSSRINLIEANRRPVEQLVFINGGLKAKGITELYLIPPGAGLPTPKDGRDITTVLNSDSYPTAKDEQEKCLQRAQHVRQAD